MAIRWKNVKITDNSGKVHPGFKARTFIQDNCPETISNIDTKGFEDVVRVKLSDGTTSLDLSKIKDVLKSDLDKIGAGLEILDGKTWSVVSFPVAKKVENVLNIIQPKLKVEFIYKHDSRAKTKKYLEDPVVAVTAAFAGNANQPAAQNKKDAPKGIADYGTVLAGKYTLTPDYSQLEKCKFDFDGKPIDIVLSPGDDKIVTFEVEPLYQKVQLIAHCLLAIPDRTYETAPNEALVANPKYGVLPDQAPRKVVDATDITQLPKEIGADALKGQWKGKYHGLLDDKADMNARVNLLKATLNYAYNKAKNDPTILKVFMLPECYFQGLYGAYLIQDADHLVTQLLNLVGDVQWRDWVFVFGTVNFTFSQGKPGIDEGIREMMNYSPVIRGGLGAAFEASGSGGEQDKHLRLIQKLVNSAELLDASELIKKGGEIREPSVNDAVQFQATQNEEQVGAILSRFFDETELGIVKKRIEETEKKTDLELGGKKVKILDELKNLKGELESALVFGVSKGLPAEQWVKWQEELMEDVKTLGLTRIVRSIRLCNIEKTPDTLTDWVFSGFKDKKKAHLSSNQVFLVKDDPFKKIFNTAIKQEWDSYWREMIKPEVRFKPTLSKVNWNKPSDRLQLRNTDFKNNLLDDLGTRQKRILENIKNIIVELDCSESQDEKLREAVDIENLLNAPTALPDWTTGKSALFDDNTELTTGLCFSKYPMWKKLLELYYKDRSKDVAFLQQSLENMNYKDYCLATARKAGPWLTFEEVEKLDACKKLIFGLEICADHASGRLKSLVQENLPSALVGDIRAELELIPDDNNPDTKAAREKRNAEIFAENLKIRNENRPLIDNKRKIKEVQDRNDKKPKVNVDIHLLPSAGMFPLNQFIVARAGGYCFNCDGWNKGVGTGVNLITEWFDGIDAKNVSPVTPHTAIAKGGGVSLDMDSFVMEQIKLETVISPALGKDILNKSGMGELHIYNELDLPKD